MFCPTCGVESTNKTNYCKSCGANLSQAGSTVQVNIPRPPIAAMTWAIAAFGIVGLIASLDANKGGDSLVACLMFLFLVIMPLSYQLGRLISVYRDTIKRTIENEKVVIQIPQQPVQPQRQQSYVPPAQEPASSVIENTTRAL
ncbi:MAG: hypothetical protein J2P31_07425 [Blastocatellia bacterium]|nr:hypothetical protein [Blastocatellia bacterium]